MSDLIFLGWCVLIVFDFVWCVLFGMFVWLIVFLLFFLIFWMVIIVFKIE